MQKFYFHNGRYDSEKKVEKESIPLQFTDKKNIVDINKLLNRVRIDRKNETKKQIIFYSAILVLISLFGFFTI